MQKKLVLALLLMTVFIGGAFAQINLSVGGGGLFDYSAYNGLKIYYPASKESYSGVHNMSYGGYIFFDITYAELDVSFAFGSLSNVAYNTLKNVPEAVTSGYDILQIGFSLLGKIPVTLGVFTVFPLLGVEYNIVLSAKSGDGEYSNPGYYNQFGFLAGGGGDFYLTKYLFLRAEALFHIRLPSKIYDDQKKSLVDEKKHTEDNVETTWGMGPRVKIGVGFRF
jgi:hypothetical protein